MGNVFNIEEYRAINEKETYSLSELISLNYCWDISNIYPDKSSLELIGCVLLIEKDDGGAFIYSFDKEKELFFIEASIPHDKNDVNLDVWYKTRGHIISSIVNKQKFFSGSRCANH